jgi:hypothetical protein
LYAFDREFRCTGKFLPLSLPLLSGTWPTLRHKLGRSTHRNVELRILHAYGYHRVGNCRSSGSPQRNAECRGVGMGAQPS